MTDSSRSSPTSSPNGKHSLEELLKFHHVHLEGDNRVCWNRFSKQHPRNWSLVPKLYTVAVICWLEMYMTAISSSGTAAAESAREDYGISRTLAYFAFVTIYLLGQTVGGIFCSPISEVFGRRTIYIVATIAFCIFSAITAAIDSLIAVFFGRFFQGIAAAIPATVAFGNFEDMYDAEHRIWVVYFYTITGMLGLALGPVYSTYVTALIGWRWVFYISTIASGASAVACIFIRESNAYQLLENRVQAIRKETGISSLRACGGGSHLSFRTFVQNSLFRPLIFLVTEPLLTLCAILCAIAFGLIYGLTESLTVVYTSPPFNFSMTSSSLAFIPIIIGELLNVLPRFYDAYIYKSYRRQRRRILPETKIASFAVAAPMLAIGLWLFAWTIPPRVTDAPWPVSMIGLVCIGFSLNDFSYVLFGYATDSYGELAASAVSAVGLTRTVTAAVFPLFTYQMYTGLGSNVATSILAAVATLFAGTPFLFLRYGGALRRQSRNAANDDAALKEENSFLKAGEEQEGREGGGIYSGEPEGEEKQVAERHEIPHHV